MGTDLLNGFYPDKHSLTLNKQQRSSWRRNIISMHLVVFVAIKWFSYRYDSEFNSPRVAEQFIGPTVLITSLMNAFIVSLSPVLPEDENIAHGLADRMRALSTISRVRLLMRQRLVCSLAPRRYGNDSRPHYRFRKLLSAIRQHYLSQCWPRFMSSYDVARPWVV